MDTSFKKLCCILVAFAVSVSCNQPKFNYPTGPQRFPGRKIRHIFPPQQNDFSKYSKITTHFGRKFENHRIEILIDKLVVFHGYIDQISNFCGDQQIMIPRIQSKFKITIIDITIGKEWIITILGNDDVGLDLKGDALLVSFGKFLCV